MLSKDKLESWRWRNNPNKCYVFWSLLFKANFKPENFEKIIVGRGQLVFSYDRLSAELGVSLQTLRTTLKDLVETGDITIQPTRRWSLLTICEYDSWQNSNNPTNTIPDTITDTLDDTNIIINNNNKENKDSLYKEKIVKKKVVLDLSIVEDKFLPIVNDWLAYKKERGETYKQIGFKTFYKHLLELSNDNPLLARKIVDKSMSCNYAGIFPLKESETNAEKTESEETSRLEKFVNWVTRYYPTISDMEMPNEEQLDDIKQICGNNAVWYFDQLQDMYHSGSLYELFMERFGSN